MRIAVIDMGTNTFNLLIVECASLQFQILYSTKQPVKLGQRSTTQHIIDASAQHRILHTLQQYLQIIQNYRVDKIIAVATSSIRTAKNQLQILQDIQNKLHLKVDVIDGEREAELIYYANRYAIQMNNDTHLIMDIGGGSTEFIIANAQQIFWKKSFLLGMARLIDEIKPQDPIHPDDIERTYHYLQQSLMPLSFAINTHHPQILVGSSGVFDSLVEMIEANLHLVQKTNSACEISIDDFYTIYHQILPLSYQERLNYKGLIQMRADMIVMSLILIDYILKTYDLKKIKISFYSLKEGIVIEQMSNKCSSH